MGLFTPAWRTKEPKRIPKAVRELSKTDDTDKLIRVAKEAPLSEIRGSAKTRLIQIADRTDIEELRHILISIDSGDFTLSVLGNIMDQEILKELFIDQRPYSKYAAGFITDRGFLLGALNDTDRPVDHRIAALYAIDDDDVYFDVACNEPTAKIRRAALEKIHDIERIEKVTECAFERAKRLSGQGVIPKNEYCEYEFRYRTNYLCSHFDSSKLRFVDPTNGKILCYNEYQSNDGYGLIRTFNVAIHRTERNGVKDFYLEFPHAVVEYTDDPVGDDEILVCPKCSHLREGNGCAMPKCTCGSEMSAVRMKYDTDRDRSS